LINAIALWQSQIVAERENQHIANTVPKDSAPILCVLRAIEGEIS
jgi:hypothetical protein